MEFSVGEHIVHPAHGTGTVVGVKNQELATGYQRYYVIRFADKRLTVQVPSRKADEIGLRSVMGSNKCEEVMRVLRSLPQTLPDNFKERRSAVESLLHSGRPVKVAEALRNLSWRREMKPLNKADSDLYAQACGMLTQEMALATGDPTSEVERRIHEALDESIRAKLLTQKSESE